MSPVIKEAQHRGKAPILGTLAHYLVAEEGREACHLMDASGREISAEELTEAFGGQHGAHWHAIVSPTFEDCVILTARHGGNAQAAAIAQGRAIAQRVERDTGRPVAFAAHFEHRDGKPHFHFHLVGQGEPRARLYGRSGLLQRAWDRAVAPDRKPIVDWAEHAAFRQTREELRVVQKEMRTLGEARRRAIAAAPPEQKAEVRAAYLDRELELIPRRYELEVKAIGHRYAARNDLGSDRHQAELVDAANRQKGALTRATFRGEPREMWGNRSGVKTVQLARTAAAPLEQGVKTTLKTVSRALTVEASPSNQMPHGPVIQPQEIALAAARAALQVAGQVAQRAAGITPPGLAVQAAQLALNLPQKALDLALPDQGKLPSELTLPLRAASAVPGVGLVAKVASLTAQETLKPLLKETER